MVNIKNSLEKTLVTLLLSGYGFGQVIPGTDPLAATYSCPISFSIVPVSRPVFSLCVVITTGISFSRRIPYLSISTQFYYYFTSLMSFSCRI